MTLEFKLTDGTPMPPADANRFDAMLALLRADKVTEIAVSGEDANSQRLAALALAVPAKQNLASVAVTSSRNTSEDQAQLFTALAFAPNLRALDLGHCFGEGVAIQALANLISTHQNLSRVDMKYNGLLVPKTQILAPVIAHNGGLRELDISYNAMGAPGVDILAAALETNKGLVKINVDTTYDIEPSIPAIERMLEKNHNLMACDGLSSDTIEQRLKENHDKAAKLAKAIADPEKKLTKPQFAALQERMAGVAYLLENEQGMSRDAVRVAFKDLLVQGRKKDVDCFPAMMAVFPVGEMFALSAELGNPLSIKDFHHARTGGTPLLDAVIQRGAGAMLFRKDMGWQSGEQVDAVYKLLPEVQQRQVTNRFQLKAQVQAETRRGYGRHTGEIAL